MTIAKWLAVAAVTILVAGCVSAPEIKSTFDPAEAEIINKTGPAKISGQAFLRRNDGVVVYAAGSDVTLIPASVYARERIAALYRGGKINSSVPDPTTTDPRYLQMVRKAKADGEGRFEFAGVADGSFYVVTSVFWMAGDLRQGGGLQELVTVANGQSVNLVMTGA